MTLSNPNPTRHLPTGIAAQICVVLSLLIPSSLLFAATLPIAPQTFNTTYAPPNGQTITIPPGGDLQAALNDAHLGDTIILQAGATYTGPFTLPDKTSGSGWIYVVSSNYSSLPPPGTRVSPSDAADMPKILAPPDSTAIVTVPDSNHFRFVGIEFATEPVSDKITYQVIQIGNGDTSPSTLPNNIVFDRCYIHGYAAQNDRRGAEIDGAYIAVIDSYISAFQETGTDSQGLWAYNTTGPLKIVNDYIEAAGENVMFGGAESKAPSLIPSDIEIKNNYFYKPLSLIGAGLNAKNLLEFKDAKRVLVTGNTFDNNPAAAQDGFALLITPRDPGGRAPWSTTQDISIVGNTFINVGSGINIAGFDANHPSYPTTNPTVMTKRILVQNNLIEVTGVGGADGRDFQFLEGGSDYTIDHNTVINTATGPSDIAMVESKPLPITNFVFINNIFNNTEYGFFGSGAGSGTAALNRYFSNWTFQKNVLTGVVPQRYPAGNHTPPSISDVSFKNYAEGDFSLAASSPYKNAGTDRLDIGAQLPLQDAVVPSAPQSAAVK